MEDRAVLAITETALERVRGFQAGLPEGAQHALAVRITGVADGEFVHALALEPLGRPRQGDVVQHEGDLAILVAGDSVARLRGATGRAACWG